MKRLYIFLFVTIVVGVVSSISTYILKPDKEIIETPRVVLSNEITGGFVPMTGVTVGTGIYTDLPMTAVEAKSEGWVDSILCASGKGRYFYKSNSESSNQTPYLLMYNIKDELIGVYFYTIFQMPEPWKTKDELKPFSETIIDFQHSNLIIFFKDPVNACRKQGKNSDGTFN